MGAARWASEALVARECLQAAADRRSVFSEDHSKSGKGPGLAGPRPGQHLGVHSPAAPSPALPRLLSEQCEGGAPVQSGQPPPPVWPVAPPLAAVPVRRAWRRPGSCAARPLTHRLHLLQGQNTFPSRTNCGRRHSARLPHKGRGQQVAMAEALEVVLERLGLSPTLSGDVPQPGERCCWLAGASSCQRGNGAACLPFPRCLPYRCTDLNRVSAASAEAAAAVTAAAAAELVAAAAERSGGSRAGVDLHRYLALQQRISLLQGLQVGAAAGRQGMLCLASPCLPAGCPPTFNQLPRVSPLPCRSRRRCFSCSAAPPPCSRNWLPWSSWPRAARRRWPRRRRRCGARHALHVLLPPAAA